MFWRKQTEPDSLSIDEIFHRKLKRYQLKQRVARACTDTTDYELWLKNFLTNNRNNARLISECANYRRQLIESGIDSQQAAKQTLEKFRH
jgi:hypothetical protein